MTEKTLSEQLREAREGPQPDQFLTAWWKKEQAETVQQVRGLNYSVNNAVAEARDCWAELKKQRTQNELLQNSLMDAQAEIAKLRGTVSELTDRVDRIAEHLNRQKGKS